MTAPTAPPTIVVGGRARLEGEPVPAGVDAHHHPGARRPDRHRWIDSHGLRLSVWEWGDPEAPPVLFAHGGFDFAGTYDALAPLVADGGWRVVAWDQRGHGDSDHATLYSWEADLRDAAAVLATVADGAVPVLGHSKGGALSLQLADACPHRVSHVVNLDGLPSARSWPDVSEHHRTRLRAEELAAWLDHRGTAGDAARRPGTIDELAARRGRMNPRLDPSWLRYVVPIGAGRAEDGWRWKIDPSMRMGGFGPWRPEWSMWRLPSLGMPVLCVLGLELELMGWGTLPEDVTSHLPPQGRYVGLDGVGHFMHVEQPALVAELVLDFLA
jgi:pimeloyl-ACP methyl ester carboxylesterase